MDDKTMEEIMNTIGVKDSDISDTRTETPSDKETIEKNTYLINHIRDNHEKDVPSDIRDEMYDTIMNMTNAKLLENSNLFTYMICGEIREDASKLMDSVLAMHGIMTKLLCKFGDEIADYLSGSERGTLNVLHFGRTSETLPSKDEILAMMKEFSEASTIDKKDLELSHAMFPTLVKGIGKQIEDVMEQACATGIYAMSKDAKVIKGAIAKKLLLRLFLPLASGNGVYAVKVSDRPNTKKDDIMELVDKVGDMSEEEFKQLLKQMMKSKKEKN